MYLSSFTEWYSKDREWNSLKQKVGYKIYKQLVLGVIATDWMEGIQHQ